MCGGGEGGKKKKKPKQTGVRFHHAFDCRTPLPGFQRFDRVHAGACSGGKRKGLVTWKEPSV